MGNNCSKKKIKYLCGGCGELHDDVDFDPRIDKVWEELEEIDFLKWVYVHIGDESEDVMLEIDKRIELKGVQKKR